MACACVSKKAAKILLGISGAVLIISIATLISFQKIYNTALKQYIALSEGSLVTKIWEDIPLPIYEKLYFFNITNEKAFLKGIEPLNVTEVGPYTFKSNWVKDHLQWNSNNTVSYRETRTYQFVPELSNGTEDDVIFTLNGPMIIGASLVPFWLKFVFDAYCISERESIVTKKSIRQLAYEGYTDSVIKYAKILRPDAPYKHNIFSWLYGKNASDDGLFTVFTGTDDESKTDFINNWNGEEKLKFWHGDTCNMLNGTSIETGPPIKDNLDSYTFFQSFFCRSITFDYTEDVRHFDILAKRFRPTHRLFANSTVNPDNYCFEVQKERASGVLDISNCQFGAPVIVSFPHFHLADPSYLNPVNGLNPDNDKHGSYIDVEPITGLSIDLTVRFQINIEVKEISGIHFFSDVTKGVLPVFWAELSLKIDEDFASFLKHQVRDPKIIAVSVLGALLLMSLTGMIVSIAVLCRSKSEEEELLIAKDNEALPESKCDGYGAIKDIEVLPESKCDGYGAIKEIATKRNVKITENDAYPNSILSINDSKFPKSNSNESSALQEAVPNQP